MADLPIPPQQISDDGREIWDWASKLSVEVHRRDEMRKLHARIIKIGTRCGDCDKWMKSRECPKERNVKGYSRGPSCEEWKCGEFVEKSFRTGLREELKAELATLERAAQQSKGSGT